MKTCFSEKKLVKQFGKLSLSEKTPPFNQPLYSEPFFHDSPSCPSFKNPVNFRGGERNL